MCGTLDYLCPEIINGEAYSFECDIWALGVIMYEFLFGCPPFMKATHASTYKAILSSNPCYTSKGKDVIDNEAIDLLQRLLMKIPSERIPLSYVITHPWITKNATVSSDYI